MLFALNHATDRPIYAQIGDRIKFAVTAGLLRPGDLVPSVRELSRQLVVNPNTVARAYRDLQIEHVLEPVRGTGLQVGPGAVEVCWADRRAFVRQRIAAALVEVKQSGLPAAEVEAILRSEWAAAHASGNGHSAATDPLGGNLLPEGADQ